MSKSKDKINVLHLISSFEVGGAEKLLINLLKNTPAHRYVKFTVIVMNDKVDEGLKKQLLSTGLSVYFLNRKERHKHPKYILKLMSLIRKHKIDIVHSHNYGSKSWSILCKIFNPGLKLVHTVHDTNIFKNLSNLNLFSHKRFIDKNIAISKAVLNECNQYGINKVVQIYNGINLKDFTADRKSSHSDNFLNIINISRIVHSKKGQDVLIKALNVCKDKGLKFKCDFVGGVYDYSKDSFEYLKNLVDELNLKNEITFLENRTDISELLSQSDLFILPSRYEGLGLVVLEAMAAKVPVIVSDIEGPAELVTDGNNGLLFKSESHIDLADKILYLYNNQKKMEDLAQNAHEFVQDFDISFMCKKYCEVYKKLEMHK